MERVTGTVTERRTYVLENSSLPTYSIRQMSELIERFVGEAVAHCCRLISAVGDVEDDVAVFAGRPRRLGDDRTRAAGSRTLSVASQSARRTSARSSIDQGHGLRTGAIHTPD